MKAYIQIIDSKVMFSKLPKPEESDFMINLYGQYGFSYDDKKYQQALKAFNDSIIGEAENAEQVHDEYYAWIRDEYLLKHNPHKLFPNQPCEVEGLRIVKLTPAIRGDEI